MIFKRIFLKRKNGVGNFWIAHLNQPSLHGVHGLVDFQVDMIAHEGRVRRRVLQRDDQLKARSRPEQLCD